MGEEWRGEITERVTRRLREEEEQEEDQRAKWDGGELRVIK